MEQEVLLEDAAGKQASQPGECRFDFLLNPVERETVMSGNLWGKGTRHDKLSSDPGFVPYFADADVSEMHKIEPIFLRGERFGNWGGAKGQDKIELFCSGGQKNGEEIVSVGKKHISSQQTVDW